MGSRLSRHSSPEEARPARPGRPEERRFPLASLWRGSRKPPGALSATKPAPYERRAAWIREIQATLRARRRERALRVLCLLREDLGLEGTFLSEVLYKNAAFLNLVDPISHELLMSLARDLQCPKKEYDPWKSADRVCWQLIYHLTPHSKWHQHSKPRRKSRVSLKNSLQKKLSQDAMDLSGIPLSTRDIHHMAYYLQNNGNSLSTVDLSFTDLNDEKMHLLLPVLWSLPKLTHLSLNGNRLTKAIVKELTDAMKDMSQFPCLAWIDLGNNVDVSSMPHPLLVGLRKRLSLQTALPTIYESLDSDSELSTSPRTGQLEDMEVSTPLQAAQPKAEGELCNFLQQSCKRCQGALTATCSEDYAFQGGAAPPEDLSKMSKHQLPVPRLCQVPSPLQCVFTLQTKGNGIQHSTLCRPREHVTGLQCQDISSPGIRDGCVYPISLGDKQKQAFRYGLQGSGPGCSSIQALLH